ncbi:MAG: 5'/3'-nucleotidase SurE [Rhizobacter sp.]|nr:5'/3'-nucleotidase SurE [Bacteriovorax sp.]
MLNIVLTNDDGVNAPGINILKETLSSIANVIIVAPMTERSTTGHTLTLDTTVRLEELENNIYSCNGFPADCSLMAIGHLFKNPQSKYYGQKIDLVISGINRGANLGQDVFYSGTVAAAREAAFHGIPAIAVSSCMDFRNPDKNNQHYYSASNFIKTLVQSNISKQISPMSLLNVNVPWCSEAEILGARVTKTGLRKYSEEIDERIDFRGRKYYWIGGIYKGFEKFPDSDCQAVEDKMISVAPVKLCDYGRSQDELMESLKGFLQDIFPR